jgi:hypothetical protein
VAVAGGALGRHQFLEIKGPREQKWWGIDSRRGEVEAGRGRRGSAACFSRRRQLGSATMAGGGRKGSKPVMGQKPSGSGVLKGRHRKRI